MPVTLIFAGLMALLLILLSLRVSLVRRSSRISLGDGADPLLVARVRTQANFVEYAPFAILLVALLEMTSAASLPLTALLAGLFLLARILHPLGMEKPAPNAPRLIGTLMSWGVLVVMAALALAQGVRSLSVMQPG